MNKILIISLLLLLLTLTAQASKIMPGIAVVKLKGNATPEYLANRADLITGYKKVKTRDDSGLHGVYTITFERAKNVISVIQTFQNDENIEYIEPLYVHYTNGDTDVLGSRLVPNDPEKEEQWYLSKIQAFDAWGVSTGSDNVVLAIIDTGVDLEHDDLEDNLWHNPGEIADNYADDDSNGYADDVYGWDFHDNDKRPNDLSGHGTHCAGIASATTDNNIGVSGIGWNCKIMAIRAGNGTEITHGYSGVIYAAENGARVISLSWGRDGEPSSFEQEVIDYANSLGAVVLAAAGNDHLAAVQYPAAYDNVMGVISTDINDRKATNSSFGQGANICAPGVSIYNTYKDNSYRTQSGTSMATPCAAGVLGLIASIHPQWDSQQLFEQALVTADDISDENPGYIGEMGAGRINAYRALSESNPSIRIFNIETEDDNMNGVLEPGEMIDLQITLRSVLTQSENIVAELISDDPVIQVTQKYGNFSSIPMGGYSQPQAFQIQISNDPPHNHKVTLELKITDGDYEGSDYFTLTLLSSWGQHNVGNVDCGVSDIGVCGNQRGADPGFRYPIDGEDFGYSGTLVVGSTPDWVADGYGKNQSLDEHAWETAENGFLRLIQSGEYADSEGLASYKADRYGEHYLVHQESFAWGHSNENYRDFVIFRFWVVNNGISDLDNVFVGYYWDFDIDGSYYQQNMVGYDDSYKLGYMWDAYTDEHPYCGLQMLKPLPFAFRHSDQAALVYPDSDIHDDSLFVYMSTPIFTQSTEEKDYAMLMSAGPYYLAPEDTAEVVFAFVAGDDLDDLKINAYYAQEAFKELPQGPGGNPGNPSSASKMHQSHPNPFNHEAKIPFELSSPSIVTMKIYDIYGRLVKVLLENQAYSYSYIDDPEIVLWHGKDEDGEKCTSGVYICKFEAKSTVTGKKVSQTQKIVLIR